MKVKIAFAVCERGMVPLSEMKAPLVLRLALSAWARRWRVAYQDRREPWHNRCVDCQKPLCCLIQKYNRCYSCWTENEVHKHWHSTGECLKCEEQHECLACDCPHTGYGPQTVPCTCPQDSDSWSDYSSESTVVHCRGCGRNCEGGDWMTFAWCSRACMARG